MNEIIFRILAGLIFLTGIGISSYYRRRADRDTGERVSRRVDGNRMMAFIKFFGLLLWFSPLVYMLNPRWMEWSRIGLPDGLRWLGVGTGVLCVAGIYWLFSSIGSGITATSATRRQHSLVTHGPYRWVRHPLYTIAASLFLSLGLIADNWFILALGILAFVVMAIRTPKEEANLVAKFGDEYRQYMRRTGRFLPRIGR